MEAAAGDLCQKPYATLSHCWGTEHILKTTKSNIEQHCHGIPEDSLSKSFREAISFARSLQLRYLWIDSLCILQDDQADWEQEADLMRNVYRYSFITIAATGALNGSEGCFWERAPEAIRPTFFTMNWTTTRNSKQAHAATYQVVPDHDTWGRKLLQQPLNTRGWVLQERILSPRVVHFGNKQVFWECRETITCETYPFGLPARLRENRAVDIKTILPGDAPRDALRDVTRVDNLPSSYVFGPQPTNDGWPITVEDVPLTATLNSHAVYKDWDGIVELYSQLNLTYTTDKLVALSGVASAFSENRRDLADDRYLAGLWNSSLPSHLLWTTDREFGSARKGKYIAPTWSWASIHRGSITFKWCQRNYALKEYLTTLQGAQCVSASASQFGETVSGYVLLRGPLASFAVVSASDHGMTRYPYSGCIFKISSAFAGQHHHKPVSVPPDWRLVQEIFFDCFTDTTLGSEYMYGPDKPLLTLLPVVSIESSATESGYVLGLVLERHAENFSGQNMPKSDRTFRRIGFFKTARPQVCNILRNLPERIVTIL